MFLTTTERTAKKTIKIRKGINSKNYTRSISKSNSEEKPAEVEVEEIEDEDESFTTFSNLGLKRKVLDDD